MDSHDARDILVVAHSRGGAPATQAITASQTRYTRALRNLGGGVVHLLYMCAFAPFPGESVVTCFAGIRAPVKVLSVSSASCYCLPVWDGLVLGHSTGSAYLWGVGRNGRLCYWLFRGDTVGCSKLFGRSSLCPCSLLSDTRSNRGRTEVCADSD